MAIDIGFEIFKEYSETMNENVFGNNLFSSIDKARKNKKKTNNLKRNLKIQNKITKLDDYIEKSKYKYITIKLNSNLYFDISHCGYIYIDQNMFIPNTNFLGQFDVVQNSKKRPKIYFHFNPNLKISKEKTLINQNICLNLGHELLDILIETNKEFESCLGQKIPIQFCKFQYDYHIKYILNRHEIGIVIYDKNKADCTELFIDHRKEIHTWVIHTLEKYDKDFYIDRLKYFLRKRELELRKLKKKNSFV